MLQLPSTRLKFLVFGAVHVVSKKTDKDFCFILVANNFWGGNVTKSVGYDVKKLYCDPKVIEDLSFNFEIGVFEFEGVQEGLNFFPIKVIL